MSRIGKMLIEQKKDVKVDYDQSLKQFRITGPKGEFVHKLHRYER